MSKLNLDVRAVPVAEDRLSLSVAYQNPEVAAALPFQASNGTLLTVVGGGRPYVGICGGRLTVGLRGPACPDAYRHRAVEARIPAARQAARQTAAAVKELRDRINGRKAVWGAVDAFAGGR